MTRRKDYFYRQKVTEAELDSGFAYLEDADHLLMGDLALVGVFAGGAVSQHSPVANLTVDVAGPGTCYDQVGQRVAWSGLQNVNCAVDSSAVSTAVAGGGNEKWLSIFVAFDRVLTDPRTDGNSLTVFFDRAESFRFVVVQGVEAAIGAATKPALQSDKILLADVRLINAQTQILNADIQAGSAITHRRQDAIVITGTKNIRRGNVLNALTDFLGYYNNHIGGTADKHPAADINYAGGAAWFDSTTNPAASVEAQLDKIVTDLGGAGGAAKIGYAGGGTWFDAGTNPATSVELQLDKIVADLAANSGADKIGVKARTNWAGGRVNVAGVSVFSAIDKIITDLAAQTGSDDGAERIGAQVSGNLPVGSVCSQLDALASSAHENQARNIAPAACGCVPTAQPPAATDCVLDRVNGYIKGSTNLTGAIIPVPVFVGERIQAATVHALDIDGTHTFTAVLRKVDMTTNTITNKSNVFTSAGTGLQAAALTGITPAVVAANERWEIYWEIQLTGGGNRELLGAVVTVDKP